VPTRAAIQPLDQSSSGGGSRATDRDTVQALVEEALADLIEKHKNAKPRVHVMGAYLASHEKLGPPYIRDHGLARWKRGVGEKPCEGFAPTGPA